MATPASESAAACAVTGAWACGFALQVDAFAALFARYPAIGFIALSITGALVGWCLLLEKGHFDGATGKPKLRTLASRLAIGSGVGFASALLYAEFNGVHKGVWMITSAAIAMFPLEAASGKLPELLAKWRSGK